MCNYRNLSRWRLANLPRYLVGVQTRVRWFTPAARPHPPVWSSTGGPGQPGTGTPQRIGRDHRACSKRGTKLPAVAHTPPNAVAAAQVPRGLNPRSAHQTRRAGCESLFLDDTHAARQSQHLVSPPTRQLHLCTLVQWPSPARCTRISAAIDCGPALLSSTVSVWSIGIPLSHVKSMADMSLPARLVTGVEQLVWSTYMVAREFPFTILPLILIAFASLALLAVSLIPPIYPRWCLPVQAAQKRRGMLPSHQPIAHRAQVSPEHCPIQNARHSTLVFGDQRLEDDVQGRTLC